MNSKKDVVAQLHKFLTSVPDGSGQLYALATSHLEQRRVPYPVNRCLASPQNRSDGLEKSNITKLTAKMASVLAKSE